MSESAHIFYYAPYFCSLFSCRQLDDLSLAVDTVRETKRRMLDIQRRVDAVKATVGGWRQQQIAEAEAALAAKQQQQQTKATATTATAK